VGEKIKSNQEKPELEIRVEFLPEEEREVGQERLRRVQRWLLSKGKSDFEKAQ